jgi:hypothetical protein
MFLPQTQGASGSELKISLSLTRIASGQAATGTLAETGVMVKAAVGGRKFGFRTK